MLPRFVLVPALPFDRETSRFGMRCYTQALSSEFDIYDNREKVRLKMGYPDRAAGEKACAKMNVDSPNPEELFSRQVCE